MSEAPPPTSRPTEGRTPPEPLTAERLGRAYALSGLVWLGLSALLMLLGWLQLAWGLDLRVASLGVGRLHVAYRFSALFGAIVLPPAGLLASRVLRSETDLLRARRGLQAWNLGLTLGSLAILAGLLRPAPAAGAPAVAEFLIWIGGLYWLRAIASATASRPGLRAGEALGLLAGLGSSILLLLGMLLMSNLRGHGQALASSIYLRGLIDLWAVPLALSTAALLLSRWLEAPIYGRRALLLGFFAWPSLSVLGLSRDLAPDILADWLIRPAEAFASLAMVAVVALAIALFGSFIGRAAPAARSRPALEPSAPEADAPRSVADPEPQAEARDADAEGLLLVLGLCLLLGAMWMEAWRLPAARRLLMLGPWSVGELFPTWSGLLLLSAAAGRALLPPRGASGARARRISRAALMLGAVLVSAPAMAAGLSEAAVGASAELLVAQARWRLPGALIFSIGLLGWFREAWRFGPARGGGDRSGSEERAAIRDVARPADVDPPVFPGTSVVLASTAAILSAGLIVSILVPLADPMLDEPGPRAGARRVDPGSLAAEGQALYTSHACAVCHSQRVRAFEAGASMGPATGAGDFAGAPAHTGQRRAGPDLSWVGDFPSLIEGLPVTHAPGGIAPMPWLFERGGPTPEGERLLTYLEGLSARTSLGRPEAGEETVP